MFQKRNNVFRENFIFQKQNKILKKISIMSP